MAMIVTRQRGIIYEINLNRPEKRNAIQVQMLEEIAAAVTEAEQTPGVRAIIVRGEGDCFSAGLDFIAMGGMPAALGDNWMKQGYRATRMWQTNIHRLQQSTLPTIALLHSYTLGAGLELALGCDLRIAADNVVISLEEARLGMIPDAGGTSNLTLIVGAARAKELIFTGRRIDAATADKWGLVNQVVPLDNLIAAGDALAEEIALSAPLAVAAAKRVINGIENNASGLHLEMIEQTPLFQTKDIMEGLQSKMERRQATWKGE